MGGSQRQRPQKHQIKVIKMNNHEDYFLMIYIWLYIYVTKYKNASCASCATQDFDYLSVTELFHYMTAKALRF